MLFFVLFCKVNKTTDYNYILSMLYVYVICKMVRENLLTEGFF